MKGLIPFSLLIFISCLKVFAQTCPTGSGYTKTDITCYGNNNGIITATVNIDDPSKISFVLYDVNGDAPVLGVNTPGRPTRVLSNGGRTVTFGDIPKGHYWVVIYPADDLPCSSPALVFGGLGIPINEPDDLSISYTSESDCDLTGVGSIQLTVSGGILPYSYSWSGPTSIGDVDSPTNLFAGTYSVIVTDFNSCQKTLSDIIVPQGTIGGILSTSTAEVCTGSNNGTITLSGHNGDVVRWESSTDNFATITNLGNGGNTSHNFSDITVTTQYRTVVQSPGCQEEFSNVSEVQVNPLPEAIVSGGGEVCIDTSAPDVVFTFTGTAPFNFTYTDGTTPVTINGHNNPTYTITNPGAGAYQITSLSDANTCSATELGGSVVVIINDLPTVHVSGGGETCTGIAASNVVFTFTGIAPFDFTYTDGTTPVTVNNHSDTEFTITNPGAGVYSVTSLTDDNGCTADDYTSSVTVTVNVLPTVTAVGGGDACSGIPASNVVFTFTGTAPFNFTYTDGTTPVTVNNHNDPQFTITNPGAGVYSVISLTDDNGCSASDYSSSVTVTINDLPTVTVTGGGETCSGIAASNVVFTFTGTAPFNFTYTDGTTPVTVNNHNDPQFTITNPGAGVYSVTSLTDDNGCTADDYSSSVNVTVNMLPTVTVTGGGETCSGIAASNIVFTFTGTAPYNFTYTDGTMPVTVNNHNDPQFTITDPGAGVYRVTSLTDDNGCTALDYSSSVAVNVNTLPTATVTGGGEICSGEPLPTVRFTFTGDTPFNFTYVNGTTINVTNYNSNVYTITNPVEGNYQITSLTDGNGCNATELGDVVPVIIHPLPTAIISGGGDVCTGEEIGITFTLTGIGPWSVVYSDGTTNYTVNDILTSPHVVMVNPTNTTSYTLISVQDQYCSGTMLNGIATATVHPLPEAIVSGGGEVCIDTSAPDVVFTFTGTAPFNFTYTDGTTPVTINGHNNPIYTISNPGEGTYEITSLSDANTCNATELGGSVNVIINQLPTVSVTGGGETCTGVPAPVVVFTFTGTAPFDFTYTDGTTPVTVNNHNDTEFTITNPGAGVYSVTSLIDFNGCTADDYSSSVSVTINDLPTVTVTGGGETCSGIAAANIVFTFTGTAPFNFTYTDGTTPVTVNNHNDSQFTITNPGAGVYSVTNLTDDNGCTAVDYTSSVIVTIHELPTVTVTGGGETCSGISATNVVFTFTGTAPFNFTYTDGTTPVSVNNHNDTEFTITNPGAGLYSVTSLTDDNGCTADDYSSSVTVTIHDLPNLIITDPTVCAPSTVDLTDVSVTAGSDGGNFTYWTDALATNPLANPGAVAISGTYYIKLTSPELCETIAPVLVTISTAPVLVITDPAAVCEPNTIDLTDLAIISGSSAGTPTYWMDALATIPIADPVNISIGGTYYIKLTDGGCETIEPVQVTINSAPQSFDLSVTNGGEFCAGSPGVTIGLTGSEIGITYELHFGGSPVATVPGTGNAISFGQFTTTGDYTAIADGGTCNRNMNGLVTVIENPLPSAPTGPVPADYCPGNTKPSIAVTAPAAGYSIIWYDQATGGSSLGTGEVFTPMAASGTFYAATLNDVTGCISSDRTAVTLTLNPAPATSAIVGNATPDCNFAGLVYSVTGLPGSTYLWTVPSGASIVGPVDGSSITVNFGLTNGNITVTETSDEGCVGETVSMAIWLQNCPLNAYFEANDPDLTICVGDEIRFTDLSTGNPTSWVWDFGDAAAPAMANFQGPHTVTYATSGSKTVSLFIEDGATTSIFNLSINVVDRPALPTINPVDPVCVDGGIFNLTADIPGGTWSGNGIINPVTGAFDPTVAALGLNEITYTVSNGTCSVSATESVEVNPIKTVNFHIGNHQAQTGTQVLIPVMVSDFDEILTTQFSISWDETVLQYVGAEQFGLPGMNILNFGNPSTDVLTFSWDETVGTTVANGTAIFAIRFNVIGAPCENTPLNFSETPTIIEVVDENLCVANWNTTSGTFNVLSSNGTLASADPVITSPDPICINDVIPTLTPAGSGPFNWYDGDQNFIVTAPNYIPTIDNTIAGDYTYFVAAQEGSCPESNRIPFTVSVSGGLAALVTVNAIPGNPICVGDNVEFTAVPTNEGSNPTYQWFVDGTLDPTATTSSFISSFTSDALVRVEMTSSLSCASPKPAFAEYNVNVTTNIIPTVVISPDPAAICTGDEITFTATVTGGGLNPTYQWQVNGSNVMGETTSTMTTNSLVSGDNVSVTVLSSASCANPQVVTSDLVPVTSNTPVYVSVDLGISHNPVCDGEAVTFTATPTNATNPVYEWFVNGVPVASVTGDTYVTTTLNDQDQVWVIMTSEDVPCLVDNPAISEIITVNEPGMITPSVSIAGPASICEGMQAGLYQVSSVVGGTLPTYEWYLDGNPTGITSTIYTLPYLSEGDHTVAVLMTKGGAGSSCISPDDVMSNAINVRMRPAGHPDCDFDDLWIQNPRVDMVSCPTESDGRIRFVIVEGSGYFRYRLDNKPWIIINKWNATINNVAYGSHRLYAEDLVSGVIDSIDVFVGSAFGLAEAPTVANPSCSGGDGVFTLKLNGGSGIYHVRVYDATNTLVYENPTSGKNVLVEDLDAGIYNVIIEDAGGNCMINDIYVTLSAPLNCNNPCYFTVQAEPIAETCYSGIIPNGQVIFHVNPKGQYDFLMENAAIGYTLRQNDTTFVNLKAGDYKYTVYNLTPGCNNVYDVGTVTVPLRKSTLDVTAEMVSNVSCYGTPTGEARLTVTYGGAAPYHYSVDKGVTWHSFNSGDIVKNLPPNDNGPYNILVADDPSDLCPAEVAVEILNAFPEIMATVTSTETSCNGNDGSFTISEIIGGLSNYIVEFGGNSYNFISGTPLVFNNMPRGMANYTIRDATGCVKPFEVFIGSPGLVYLEEPMIIQGTTCAGNGEDGRVSFRVDLSKSPLAGQYYYGFAPVDVPESEVTLQPFSAMQTRTIENLSYGDYYLLVSISGEGCPNRYNFSINAGPKKVDFKVTQAVNKICNARSGFLELGNFTGELDSTFYIRIYDATNNQLRHTGTYKYPQRSFMLDTLNDRLNPGDYYIQAVQQQDGCQMLSDYKYISIKTVDSPVIKIEDVKPSWEDVDIGSMLVRVESPKNNNYSATLDYNNWETVPYIVGPEGGYEKTYDKLAYGNYIVWVKDDNQGNKCIIQIEVEIPKNTQLWIPNIFTPNNDGYNDTFYIRNIGDDAKLIIKNRWGKIVYKSDNYKNDWDGGDLPDGLYYYQLSVSGNDVSGWIEVLRGAGPRF